MKLDPKCIVKCGYLTKSPPLEKIISKVARWHMRWFVLYDTRERSEIDPMVEREVELFYYKNHTSQRQGELPKGKINLIRAEIYVHKGKLHGFPYVINIETEERVFHLCATQKFVHKDWIETLMVHHLSYSTTGERSVHFFPKNIPIIKKPIERELTGPHANYRISSRPHVDKSSTAPTSPTYSPPRSREQAGFEAPFGEASKYFDPGNYVPARSKTNVFDIQTETFGQIIRKVTSLKYQSNEGDEENNLLNTSCPAFKIRANQASSNFPLCRGILPIDSEDIDEGIVRTSSESSSNSTAGPVMISSFTSYTDSQSDFDSSFHGPKLSPTRKPPLKPRRSISLLDLCGLDRQQPRILCQQLTKREIIKNFQIQNQLFSVQVTCTSEHEEKKNNIKRPGSNDEMALRRSANKDLLKRLAMYDGALRKHKNICISYVANV